MPAFNASGFVRDAIESVFQQTVEAVEILLVDDGSTDDTRKVVEPFLSSGRLSYLHQENQGPWVSRNHAIPRARAPFVAFLDADDLWLPEKLERQLRRMEAEPELAFVCTDYEVVDSGGQVRASGIDYKSLSNEKDLFPALLRQMFPLLSTVLYRREVLGELNGFDGSLRHGGEREIFLRTARKHRVGIVDDVLVRYRRHGANLTNKLVERCYPWDVLIYRRILDGALPLSIHERSVAETFLASRCGELIKFHLREGDGGNARKYLRELGRIRSSHSLRAFYPLTFLPRGLRRRMHRLWKRASS
ncbi:MAG: glycosyltransferase [Vicinamibacteria bacterium]